MLVFVKLNRVLRNVNPLTQRTAQRFIVNIYCKRFLLSVEMALFYLDQ